MAGLTKTVVVLWTIFILSAYTVVSIDPETFKKDIMTKLNLQEETMARKYYESFKDYIELFLQYIKGLEDKVGQGIDSVINLSDKLTNTYWYKCVQGYFVTGIPQPIKEVLSDVKESEAIEDAHDFILSYIWNPIRNINSTEIKKRLRDLQDSQALRRPHAVLGHFILDAYNKFSLCSCRDVLLSGENLYQHQWNEMPFLAKLLWFFIGFVSCFVLIYAYNYVMELKQEFNNYEEFLEAVEERKYPLDENKEIHIHRNPFADVETTDED